MRDALFALALLVAYGAGAQVDSSLTDEFGHLSAKERARIAKKEQEDAAKDVRYQEVMATAEGHFRERRYDEALADYQVARGMRPLNVYPKVKIQDLQALIAKREAARADSLAAHVPVVNHTPEVLATDTIPVTNVVRAEAPALAVEEQRALVPPERPQALPAEPRSAEPLESEPIPSEGLHERTYVEGRAIVLERKLVRDGRMEVYRKVTHPWGQVVHFRDGATISERHWNEVFH